MNLHPDEKRQHFAAFVPAFQRPGDRVRLNLKGGHQDITLAAWIGNWDNPIETPAKVRNLNGAIAELMFNAALSPDEIKTLSLNESN